MAREVARGEDLPLRLPGCHVPEGALGRERHQPGAVGLRRGGRGRLQRSFGGGGSGSEKGAVYAASLLRELIDWGPKDVRSSWSQTITKG